MINWFRLFTFDYDIQYVTNLNHDAMKKILRCVFLFAISLSTLYSSAQYRYLDEVFTNVIVESDVKYGENYTVITGAPVLEDLLMDIYMPEGDTEDMRPLIIMAHAGSYLPKGINTLPFGDRKDSCMVEMCTQFAKRGWVAVSMSYRLGWNPLAPTQEGKAGTIMNAVYRSAQDARTCVRFFQDDAANANAYKIDTMKITVGGSNSGGYTALATAYLDKVEEINLFKFQDSEGNSFINQAITGGFYGEGGMPGVNNYSNPGHTSEIQLVLNLGGAIGDTSWMEAGNIPVVAFHGIADVTTPYMTSIVIVLATLDPIVEVSGSYDLVRVANKLGLNQGFIDAGFEDPYTLVAESRSAYEGLLPFPGPADGLEPWAWYDPNDANIDNDTPGATGFGSRANPFASKPKALTFIDTIMGYFVPRAVVALGLETGVGIESTSSPEILHIYPNPTTNVVTVQTNNIGRHSIEITALNGQIIHSFVSNQDSQQVDLSSYPKGVYFITVRSNKSTITEKIIKY
jgi:hypothetical protein